jgi:RNA polymerase sigma-70 factor (ECF subfamily)
MNPNSHRALESLSDSEEAALLVQVAAGDPRAFDSLYRDYWPRLRRFLEQVTRRPHLVEELLNDTMLAVWRQAGSFKAQSRVSTWVFAIAYRKALKALKRSREPAGGVFLPEEPANDHGPESQMMHSQLRRQLTRALSTLPPEQRAVVELTYYHGCAYAEIAQILGCPVDTVKTRMFHARRKLRLLMEAQSEGV